MYSIMVDDNFHYMDEGERTKVGSFATAEEAVAACKKIVDENLAGAVKPGMTAATLYEAYISFGDDPFVVREPGDSPIEFLAWDYAKTRSEEICAGRTEAT